MTAAPVTNLRSILIAATLVLAGCVPKPPQPTSAGGVEITDGNGAMTLYNVTMPDGTKCVAAVGYYKGGLTCDWGRP